MKWAESRCDNQNLNPAITHIHTLSRNSSGQSQEALNAVKVGRIKKGIKALGRILALPVGRTKEKRLKITSKEANRQ